MQSRLIDSRNQCKISLILNNQLFRTSSDLLNDCGQLWLFLFLNRKRFLDIRVSPVFWFLSFLRFLVPWWDSCKLKQFLFVYLRSCHRYHFVNNFCECLKFPWKLIVRLRMGRKTQFVVKSRILCRTRSFGAWICVEADKWGLSRSRCLTERRIFSIHHWRYQQPNDLRSKPLMKLGGIEMACLVHGLLLLLE